MLLRQVSNINWTLAKSEQLARSVNKGLFMCIFVWVCGFFVCTWCVCMYVCTCVIIYLCACGVYVCMCLCVYVWFYVYLCLFVSVQVFLRISMLFLLWVCVHPTIKTWHRCSTHKSVKTVIRKRNESSVECKYDIRTYAECVRVCVCAYMYGRPRVCVFYLNYLHIYLAFCTCVYFCVYSCV